MKRSMKTAFLFSLLVFIILSLTMPLTGFFTMLLFRAGVINEPRRGVFLIIFAIVCIIVGTLLSAVIGRRGSVTLHRITEATRSVARGDFDVQIDENIRATEIRSMIQDFNLMIRELKSTEMLRNDFIESVSHEFKTPLSIIQGYVALMQEPNLNSEKRSLYMTNIMQSTKRLTSLTDNILTLSRLENQVLDHTDESFSLDEQLRETILYLEPNWSEKLLELDIDLDVVDYTGNYELLGLVWKNLIDKAIKFTPTGGKISIVLRNSHDTCIIKVKDEGCGMSEETRLRVFEKFYQGDHSRNLEGNGLGLALVYKIVKLHNGTIMVDSELGKGAEFIVTLTK